MRVGSRNSLSASTKPNDQSSGDAKIVLMIIYSVIETGQIVIGFKGSQGNVPAEADIESAARDHGKGVSRSW